MSQTCVLPRRVAAKYLAHKDTLDARRPIQQRMGGIPTRVASSMESNGYRVIRHDLKGDPVYMMGELGRAGTRLVSRWGDHWKVMEWTRVGWRSIDNPFQKSRTPQDAVDAARDQTWRHASMSAEKHFFDNPSKREVCEFAESKALTNDMSVAMGAVRAESVAETTRKIRSEVRDSPWTVDEILEMPGAETFSTLNRYVVQTEADSDRDLPDGRDSISKHPRLIG